MSKESKPLTAPTEKELFNWEAAMAHTIQRNQGYLQTDAQNFMEMLRLRSFLEEHGLTNAYQEWLGRKIEAFA